ncbi:XdhC family protein [Paenibacillus beijingensis]|uniref:XdhC family protein n=1 Tax=Paenibacillus beijingensis TaxID=1126833 RepID=UPI0006962015|nr:XdhC family protein [Paenibacillus beijingensis]
MDMHDLLSHMNEIDGQLVLATIMEVEGHAYRKKGVSMLMSAGGDTLGSLSPGCLEADLIERVQDVLHTGKPQFSVYDSRDPDDLSWGRYLAAGG